MAGVQSVAQGGHFHTLKYSDPDSRVWIFTNSSVVEASIAFFVPVVLEIVANAYSVSPWLQQKLVSGQSYILVTQRLASDVIVILEIAPP